jgi:hypothetical protein
MSNRRISVLVGSDGKLSVHGQRVQTQPQSFWLYYSGDVSRVHTVFYSLFLL